MWDLKEQITLTLSKSDCIVLFELLTRSYEEWRKTNPDDSSARPMLVNAERHGERRALWHLEGSIERTLPDIFSADYDQLVRDSLQELEREN